MSTRGVADARKAVAETLAYLDCTNLADRKVGSISTGMRQRVGIAQAVLHPRTPVERRPPTEFRS